MEDRAYKSFVVVQPVVRLDDGAVVGGELLLRPSGGARPAAYLRALDRLDRLRLERRLQRAALRAADAFPWRIHYNLDPRIVRPGADGWPLLAAPDPARFVLEVSERVRLGARHLSFLFRLRRRGFRLALDDAGAGWSSPTVIARLRPNIVKVDRAVVRGVEADPRRRAVVEALAALARAVGADLCAEGVETPAAAERLRSLGVAYGQGALFGLEAARLELDESETPILARPMEVKR